MAPLPANAPIGVYIHVPFCAHICPYCDFNTYSGQESLIPSYVDAVCADLLSEAERIGRRDVATIFFGGGTPSLLSAGQVGQILDTIATVFRVIPGAEITLEANPNGLEDRYLPDLLTAGVNRLSIGLQTTDRRGLRRLGRNHEASQAEAVVKAAHIAGFERISLDLIFGWPGQSLESWQTDLDTVTGWGDGTVDHLSLYSLIVEPGTPLADAVQRGVVTVPDDDEAASLYELAMDTLGRRGWDHYEVANWSRDRGQGSVHNAIYWRNGEYLGIGAGAHGRIGNERTMRHLLPSTYVSSVATGSPISNVDLIDEATARGETMMLGLRLLNEGVSHTDFAARHGVALMDHYGPIIHAQTEIGLLDLDDRGVRLTRQGLMLANDVCAEYLP